MEVVRVGLIPLLALLVGVGDWMNGRGKQSQIVVGKAGAVAAIDLIGVLVESPRGLRGEGGIKTLLTQTRIAGHQMA